MQVERSEILVLLRASHIFKGLKDEELEYVADRIEAFLYSEKQIIFEQDSEANAFYFILSGRINLSYQKGKQTIEQVLEAGDYFGEEALSEKDITRNKAASVLVSTVLLRLSRDAIRELRKMYPVLEQPLRLILNSYRLSKNIKLNWLSPREIVHFIARRHWIFMLLRLIPVFLIGGLAVGAATYLFVVAFPGAILPLLMLLIFGLFSGGWLTWSIIDWSNDYAIVTNRRVVFLERVLMLYDSRHEVPLEAILALDLKTSQMGRLIGYGDLIVRTYTGEIILNRLAMPQLIIELIDAMRERGKTNKKHEMSKTINRTIRQRLGYQTGDPHSEEDSEPVVQIKTGALQQWLSELLLLRVEHNGVVTFRTHWFILIKKIWLPSLLIFSVMVLAILLLAGLVTLPTAVDLLILIGVGPALFLWWVYQLVDWRNDRYIITQEMIIDIYKKPLGTEEKKSAPLRNILSIDYERKGFIGLVLNFGTVYIRVGDSIFTFDNVLNPAEVQRELFQRFMEFKQREEQKTEQAHREQMADFIEQYHRAIRGEELDENPDEDETI
jgi:hypothetical protein